jgi:hypothetical protein
MKQITRSRAKNNQGQIKNRKASYAQKGRRAEAGKRGKEKE